MLNGILAVISAIIAGVSFYLYTQSADNKLYLALSIIFLLAFLGLGAMFLSSRVNKTEDIHITE
jgi:ABC-type transport system involved in multi-copper enzyme maturation permease subunit